MRVPARKPSEQLWHVKDDGRIGYDSYLNKFSCPNCNAAWSFNALSKMSTADMADRFYTNIDPEDNGEVLVEKEEGGKRFLSLVPRSEAHKYFKTTIDLGEPQK